MCVLHVVLITVKQCRAHVRTSDSFVPRFKCYVLLYTCVMNCLMLDVLFCGVRHHKLPAPLNASESSSFFVKLSLIVSPRCGLSLHLL